MLLKKKTICLISLLITAGLVGCSMLKEVDLETHAIASAQTQESTIHTSDAIMDNFTAQEFTSLINVGWNLGNSLDSHYGDRTENGALGQETLWGNGTVTEESLNNAVLEILKVNIFQGIIK